MPRIEIRDITPNDTVTFTLCSTAGCGHNKGEKSVVRGTTLGDLFETLTNGGSYSSYLLLVNGTTQSPGYVIEDEDDITVTPAKVPGA